MTISLLSCKKLAKKSGIKRISKEALEELRYALEEFARKIAIDAWTIAQHSERNTILAKDIDLVIRLKEVK